MLVAVTVGVFDDVGVDVAVLVEVAVIVFVCVGVGVAVGVIVRVGVNVGVTVSVLTGVDVSVGELVAVRVGVMVGEGVFSASVKVQVTVSPSFRTMLLGICDRPWSLMQVALAKLQPSGTFSITEYGVTPAGRPPLSYGGLASVRLKLRLVPPGPPVRVKLKLVGFPGGSVTLSTLILPGTVTAMSGKLWQ